MARSDPARVRVARHRLSRCSRSSTTALCCALVLAACGSDKRPPEQRGVALGLYSEDPEWSYVDMIEEMKAVGTGRVAIVVPYYLKTARSTDIFKHPRYSVPMRTIRRTARDVRARGMEVFLFPILRVEDKTHGWRGTLAPRDKEAFYASYQTYILEFARLAEELQAELFSVGSELSSLDVDEQRWRNIVAAVRRVYSGPLTYSANWDHYQKVRFFDALDFAGVTGYFELAEGTKDPDLATLIAAWGGIKQQLVAWSRRVGRPLVLTEVGYLSQRGTAAWPWKEGADEPLDLEIQRRCYEAFRTVWNGEPRLAGVYFWNWFGWGGPTSKEYTPRNKPAAREIAAWYLRR